MDPFTLRKLAGHESISTTQIYVNISDDTLRAAVVTKKKDPEEK